MVAVSGGPDSMALLHVLRDLAEAWRWELAAAHLHHGLRGVDADADLALVEAAAGALGLPLFPGRLPEGALRKGRGSLQEKARQARYAFLEEVRARWGGRRIALGHQADDQAETVLAALIRGAGTRGLGGMPYARGALVRPLLDATRREILAFLADRAIPYRQDPSNEDAAFLRPRIRRELLPLLRRRFSPAIGRLLHRTAGICAAEDAYLEALAAEALAQKAVRSQGRVEIPAPWYRGQPEAMRRRLLRAAYGHVRGDARRLSFLHAAAMDGAALCPGGERRVHLPGGVSCVAGEAVILLTWERDLEPRPWRHPVSIPGETRLPEAGLSIRWELMDGRREAAPARDPHAILLDPGALRGDLWLRGPLPGDRLRPMGLGGSRKVQDILVDARVPRRDRWRVPLLADDEGVLWVVGHRLDERARIRPGSLRVIRAVVRPAKPSPI